MSLIFGLKVHGISAPWTETEPASLALEGEVLTTCSPGKSQSLIIPLGQIGSWGKHDV